MNSHILAALLAACFLPVVPAAAQSLDGDWRSEGYGDVFVVNGADWNTFEVTSTTCVPGATAKQVGGATADLEATFQKDGSDSFFIRSGGSNDHKIMHRQGAASDVRIDRISRVPAVCDHPTPDTPMGNFEVFTRTWSEQYISFDLRHVDWMNVIAENRPRVTADTSPMALFGVVAGMIQPLGDAHTRINAPAIGMSFHGFRLGIERSPKTVLKVTDRAYLKSPLQRFCEDQVQYGNLDESTGYLRILSFSGFSPAGGFESGLAALETALDKIFSDKSLKALVIAFTQVLMGRSPHITRIGENTQGVFSDVLERRLPNGWSFGLPNEVFLTPDGKAFDGAGIPPDIRVPVLAPADLAAGRDPGVAKALEVLVSARAKTP